MSLCRKTLLPFVILLYAFLHSPEIQAQVSDIDTSGYLPYYYPDALNFNFLVAASNGYTSEVKRFAALGADVEAKTDEGATALMLAVSASQITTIAALIELGADVNTSTSKWDTPLILASRNGQSIIAEMLIRYGADINKGDIEGVTPLHYASVYGYLELADLLLYYGADINAKSDDGTTPLMAAVWSGYSGVADILIQNGANVNIADNQGFTTYQVAAQWGDTAIMKLLQIRGADPYSVNIFGWDALATTIRYDNIEAQKMILSDKGIKLRSSLAVNPYNVAAKYSRKESLNLLTEYSYPGRYSPQFDQVAFSASGRFSSKDFFSSFTMSFTEPLWRAGIIAGIDAKLWPTRVLIQQQEIIYLQVRDKSSFAFGGIFKDFMLTDRPVRGNIMFTTSLLAGKSFGNRYPGTDIKYSDKWHFVPSAGLKYNNNRVNLFGYLEYYNSEFYKSGKIWLRTGVSFNLYFDSFRAPGKIIKWY